jgi:hypothetical protein
MVDARRQVHEELLFELLPPRRRRTNPRVVRRKMSSFQVKLPEHLNLPHPLRPRIVVSHP